MFYRNTVLCSVCALSLIHISIDEHTRVPELQLVAQSTWDKLSP